MALEILGDTSRGDLWFVLGDAEKKVVPDGSWKQELSIIHPSEQTIWNVVQFGFQVTLRRGAFVDFTKISNTHHERLTEDIIVHAILEGEGMI